MIGRARLTLVALTCLVAATACSPSIDDVIDATAPTSTEEVPLSSLPDEPDADLGAGSVPAPDSSDDIERCGGLSADDITTAIGSVTFDEVADLSGADDTTCLFTMSGDTYAVSVRTEAVASYGDGEIAELRPAARLDALEAELVGRYDGEPAVERISAGGQQAVVVTGIDSIVVAPSGSGAAVASGTSDDGEDVVITVEAAGPLLATEAPGFVPIVTNVLALATMNLLAAE